MQVTLEIPEEEGKELSSIIGNLGEAAKEGLAAKGYQNGVFSLEQVRRFMGFDNRWDAQSLLSRYKVWPGHTVEDLEIDRESFRQIREIEAAEGEVK